MPKSTISLSRWSSGGCSQVGEEREGERKALQVLMDDAKRFRRGGVSKHTE